MTWTQGADTWKRGILPISRLSERGRTVEDKKPVAQSQEDGVIRNKSKHTCARSRVGTPGEHPHPLVALPWRWRGGIVHGVDGAKEGHRNKETGSYSLSIVQGDGVADGNGDDGGETWKRASLPRFLLLTVKAWMEGRRHVETRATRFLSSMTLACGDEW